MPAINRWLECPHVPSQYNGRCSVFVTISEHQHLIFLLTLFLPYYVLTSNSFWQKFVESKTERLHTEAKISRYVTNIYTVSNWTTVFHWFWDAIFHTLKFLKVGFLWHLVVSNNQCLKLNMSLNEEDGTECTALKATKNKPDIKYLSSLVQQQKSH